MPAFSAWDIGACNCGCNYSLHVLGCNDLGLSSVAVTIRDHATGQVVRQQSTDAFGVVRFADVPPVLDVSLGNLPPRFTNPGTFPGGCYDSTIRLNPTDICIDLCATPVLTLLNASITGMAGVTTFVLEYQPGTGPWQGGFVDLFNTTWTVWFYPSGDLTIFNDTDGTTITADSAVIDCPPAFRWAGSGSIPGWWTGGITITE